VTGGAGGPPCPRRGPDATAADTDACDQHTDELRADDSMLMAYALTFARHGDNPVIREGGGVEVRPVHSGGVVELVGERQIA